MTNETMEIGHYLSLFRMNVRFLSLVNFCVPLFVVFNAMAMMQKRAIAVRFRYNQEMNIM
jgi:hypothetical protein